MGIAMPQISRTALVPYSAEQMYQLVNDVQSYPQFCTGVLVVASGVIASTDDGGCWRVEGGYQQDVYDA